VFKFALGRVLLVDLSRRVIGAALSYLLCLEQGELGDRPALHYESVIPLKLSTLDPVQ
jgi:hypothetical protein